jgi:hypothetical protein
MTKQQPVIERREAEQTDLPEHLRWQGDGPVPANWYAADGTKVYRSYEDYCDD